MKQRKSLMGKLCMILAAILMISILSSCAVTSKKDSDKSLVMIKNADMSTYGTGFAVGIPGKPVDTIVTSYSIVATRNGAPPVVAEVVADDSGKNMIASILYYDEARNFAILKLSQATSALSPVVLKTDVNFRETIYAKGFDGTGNIMSNYESFNTTDVVQYMGAINTFDELNSMVVYKYSNEFNRALAGAPAVNGKGECIGMCAYSLNSMDTYSQYILSSDELMRCFSKNNVVYMTAKELLYKNIIIITIIAGALILVAIFVFAAIALSKKGGSGKKESKKKPATYILKATGGSLAGNAYNFENSLIIGRDPSKCNIQFPVTEPGISGMHCMIYPEGENIYIKDTSSYGTFFADGTRLEREKPYCITAEKLAFYVAEPKNSFEFYRQ